MKAELNEQRRREYIDTIRARVENPRGREIHASDCDGLCNLKTFYRRMLDDQPELPDKSALFFMSGQAVETWLSSNKPEPVEKDGIWCSLDNIAPGHTLEEIKSTRKGMNLFRPITSYPWWMTRCKTYCYAYGVDQINLAVFFWVGNRKENPIDIQVWTLTFTPDELAANWAKVQIRAAILREAMESGEPIPRDKVECQSWEHANCEFRGMCYYMNGGDASLEAKFNEEG